MTQYQTFQLHEMQSQIIYLDNKSRMDAITYVISKILTDNYNILRLSELAPLSELTPGDGRCLNVNRQ